MKPVIGVLTNARAADQRSMIGYGELLLQAAGATGAVANKLQAASVFGGVLSPHGGYARLRRVAINLDRFVISPAILAGRGADIVHVVDPGNAVYLPLFRCRASIVTVHDMIPYLALADRLGGFRPSRAGRLLMRTILRQLARTDRIVCVSEATRRDLLEFSEVDSSKVTVIHNAVFQQLGPASEAECRRFRARQGIPERAEFVLHVGRNFYKNRRAVLEAVAILRRQRSDVHLVLIGALEPELAAFADRLGLTEVLHVRPWIAREEMAALYTTAGALLFPSIYEGFGYPVLEAQICGTPVICSDAGSLAEVAGDGAIIVRSDDPMAMSVQLSRVLNSSAVRLELVLRGRENARRFSYRAWVEAHKKMYDSLL